MVAGSERGRVNLPSGPTGRTVTAQGHPRAIFSRAIERGNLVIAEATAREIGRLTLEEALRLLFLYAEHDPVKFERAALRWLSRYVTEGKAVSLLKAPRPPARGEAQCAGVGTSSVAVDLLQRPVTSVWRYRRGCPRMQSAARSMPIPSRW
jgi:hypothetical protein